jgi:elongation factor Ts
MNKIELVKQVRSITGLGVLECKQSLEVSNWDVSAAVQYCKEHMRPSTKPTGAGAIFSYVHHNQLIASLVELHCATDFVVKSDDFQDLGNQLAMHVAAMAPESIEDFLTQDSLKSNESIGSLVNSVSARLNEPIKIARFQRYTLGA